MWSTEVISASDYPFFRAGQQHFDEKQHPVFKKTVISASDWWSDTLFVPGNIHI
jgi:hypothetical protein